MKSKIQAKYQIKRGLFIVNYSRQEIKLFSAFYALWALILVHLHLYGLFTVNKKWGYFRLLRNVWIVYSEQEKARRWHDLQMRIHGRSQSRQGRGGANRPRNLRSETSVKNGQTPGLFLLIFVLFKHKIARKTVFRLQRDFNSDLRSKRHFILVVIDP